MTPSRELKNYIPNLKDFEIYLSIDLAKTVFFYFELVYRDKIVNKTLYSTEEQPKENVPEILGYE